MKKVLIANRGEIAVACCAGTAMCRSARQAAAFATISNQDFFHINVPVFFESASNSTNNQGASSANGWIGLNRNQAPTGICPARSRWYGATQPMTG